jgi:Mg-chelatase subunit ChlD
MRQLLFLALTACSASIAAPGPDKHAPIIQKGNGCGAQMAGEGGSMDIAAPSSVAMGRAGGGGYARPGKAAPARIATASPSPMPIEQPSGVKAGEWDDNANYRDYINWLGQTHSTENKGKIDASGREFIVVTDADGKPVPSCAVTIDGKKLTTMASGRALLFPHAFGITGNKLTATASCLGTTASATFAPEVDGIVKLQLDAKRALGTHRTLDLAFVIDTTGSMSEEIEAVKQTVHTVSDQLAASNTDVRIGLVEYKDRSDCMLTRTFPFSSDFKQFSKDVANISAGGGGDMPEDMHAGLDAALDKLEWRSEANARMVVVIGDAPPHFYDGEMFYDDVARRAARRGIKLYTVAASGMDDLGQVVMRQMAEFTGATNMFVLRGGAGPQSVGGGDPKSACGGTHTEFSSGKLDQLIMGKVKTELASIDADPLRIAGRGTDENAKPCKDRLVVAN